MPRSQIVGILNLTPDSFSDGGEAVTVEDAIAKFARMVEEGADIIDIGAESTRPGAVPLSAEKEWKRLLPVLEVLAYHPRRKRVKISIDTYHSETAQGALSMGVDIINDVGGLHDAQMRRVLAASNCGVFVMHALTLPVDANIHLPPNTDVCAVITNWAAEITRLAQASGIAPERLVLDPGLGFGKTAGQSLQLVQEFQRYATPPQRWLIGHSRKSFLKLMDGQDRDEATLTLSSLLMVQEVGYLRVHDVARHALLREAWQ